jgi:pyridoxamine-phosphate oxidase
VKIDDLRTEYMRASLDESSVAPEPLRQFEQWFTEAVNAQMREPNAMTLATVGADGRPSARVVLLKAADARGFTFYTNYSSRKARELAAHPYAALLFYWPELERQIRIEGAVTTVDKAESDEYFAGRPRGSQLGAWASPQSEPIAGRVALEARFASVADRYADASVPVPGRRMGRLSSRTRIDRVLAGPRIEAARSHPLSPYTGAPGRMGHRPAGAVRSCSARRKRRYRRASSAVRRPRVRGALRIRGYAVTAGGVRTQRTLVILIALAIANHSVLNGSRVLVSLNALSMGASPLTVGVLMALYALLPVLLSVTAGRVSDRIGTRWPMRIGSALIAFGAMLPLAFPGFPALFASAPFVGVGFMAFQLAAQTATGEIGGLQARARNFTLLSIGFSISGFIGPLLAGFSIDHFGFRAAFALFALIPLIPLFALTGRRFDLPGRSPHAAKPHHGGILSLLRHRTLRRVFRRQCDFVGRVGLALGVRADLRRAHRTLRLRDRTRPLVVRRRDLCRPLLDGEDRAADLNEHQVLTGALLLAGAVYLVYPLSTSVLGLLALSFTLGLGLGSSQPMVLALLHTHAPPGRIGEAAGVRLSLVNMMAVGVPLAAGAVGASIGIGPVFWSVGTCLVTYGFVERRNGPH